MDDCGVRETLAGAVSYFPCTAWLWPEQAAEEVQPILQPPTQNLAEALIPPSQPGITHSGKKMASFLPHIYVICRALGFFSKYEQDLIFKIDKVIERGTFPPGNTGALVLILKMPAIASRRPSHLYFKQCGML